MIDVYYNKNTPIKNLQIDALALTWRFFKLANYLPEEPKPPDPRC